MRLCVTQQVRSHCNQMPGYRADLQAVPTKPHPNSHVSLLMRLCVGAYPATCAFRRDRQHHLKHIAYAVLMFLLVLLLLLLL